MSSPSSVLPSVTAPVVIVGGGLGGSAAAALLGHAGVRTLVLERREGPTSRPRAWILSARTQEILRGIGLSEVVVEQGTKGWWDLTPVQSLLSAPTEYEAEDPSADVSPVGSAILDQDVLEQILRDDAVAHGAVIRWGTSVAGVENTDDGVIVQLEDGTSVSAQYVILANGARAGLLDGVGIATEVVADDFEPWDYVLFRSHQLDELMEDRPGKAFLHTPSGTFIFRRDLHRWQAQRDGDTFGNIDQDLAGIVGQPIEVDVLVHSSWKPTAQLADRFQSGRVFVIGDAAHALPPSMGMGANLAIADAHNLAWKLAWVLDGRAGAGLLDSYGPERRPVDAFIVDRSIKEMDWSAEQFDEATAHLGLGYPPATSDALLGDDTEQPIQDPHDPSPRIGLRVPHQRLSDGRSTLDLVDADTFAAIGTVDDPSLDVPYARVALADIGDRVWLIRPDGHVAALVEQHAARAVIASLTARSEASL